MPITAAVQNVELFGIKMTFDSVAFTIPGIGWNIYWYGIMIALGFLCAIIYAFKNAKRFELNPDRMSDVVLVTTPVAIICARLYYVLFNHENITSFADLIGLSGKSGISGLAIYGGVIGAILCGWLMCHIRKVKVSDMLDVAAIGFLIGQAIGRWGNFFNQEAYGTFTGSSWWGMTSNTIAKEMGSSDLVHPCFLYESLWCILGAVILHILSKHKKFSGQIILSYGIWYGAGRAYIEGLRTDSLYLYGNVRVSQLLSILAVIGCSIVYYILYTKAKSNEGSENYVPLFAEEISNISDSGQNTQSIPEQTEETVQNDEIQKPDVIEQTEIINGTNCFTEVEKEKNSDNVDITEENDSEAGE